MTTNAMLPELRKVLKRPHYTQGLDDFAILSVNAAVCTIPVTNRYCDRIG